MPGPPCSTRSGIYARSVESGQIDLGPERDRRSIVEQIADGVLEGRLAALAWLLIEKRIPVLVAAGPSGTGKTALLRALLAFLPRTADVRTVAGMWESWDWLPADARAELSVLVAAPDARRSNAARAAAPLDTATGVIIVPEFSDHLPFYAWGSVARTAIRAATMGYGLAGTIHAESLEEVFGALGGPEVGASPDELSALGLVLILRAVDGLRDRSRRRVVAAHYVRPVARDAEGHVQRLPPAVLATWDGRLDSFEDFSWGVVPELAARLGMRAGDLDAERDRRAEWLDALVAAGVRGEDEVVAAIRSYRDRQPARA
jgi:hypothetical protein